MREKDFEKFKKLANKRVNNALKSIGLIGNLSNRSNYDYTDQEVGKIFKALEEEVQNCRQRFDFAKKSTNNIKFTL
jgi:methyl-accepting chemotaxis protein